mmetsp:Transcript_15429/g.33214  ORF Transcript_15429/g.33214 Transcript_15429/m.33214 type:complete len:1344 (-) Transcript_15429:16-4047(-)
MWAEALYDFTSENPEELPLKQGDVVEVTDSNDISGWWAGRKDGRQGLFPRDYVKVLDDIPDLNKVKAPVESEARLEQVGMVDKVVKVRVLWDFLPNADDELKVSKGDVIAATQSADPEWWYGSVNGASGIFPKNYTETVVEDKGVENGASSIVKHARVGSRNQQQQEVFTQPQQVVKKQGGFVFGKSPLWKHPGFIGMCADRYINGTWPPGIDAEFSSLSMSMQFLGTALDRLIGKYDDKWGLRSMRGAFSLASWVCTNLPAKRGSSANEFYLFLHGFVQRVRGMRSGDVIAFPGGWTAEFTPDYVEEEEEDSSDSENEGKRARGRSGSAEAKTSGTGVATPRGLESHLVMYVLTRQEGTFSLTVCNVGHPKAEQEQQLNNNENRDGKKPRWDGFDYHNARLDEETGKMKRNLCVTIEDIPSWRLCDSSFWFLLFRLKIYSDTSHTAKMLYETLLPYLNSKPLYANKNCFEISSMDLRTQRDVADGSFFHLLKATMRCVLMHIGLNHYQAKHISTLTRLEVCQMLRDDVERIDGLREGDAILIHLACKQLADNGAKQSIEGENSPTSTEHLQEIASLINAIDARISTLLGPLDQMRLPPQLSLSNRGSVPWGACLPMFGQFRRDCSVEYLAGKSTLPPILRPVELSLVPEHVDDFNQVALALRHCVNVCTILDNQKDLIRNTYSIRVALIQHLFIQVIPLPLPRNHPRRADHCFWYSRAMRYETQADILRLLELLGRHFVSASLSMTVTRSSDAARIITMAAVATVADAVVRICACDIPSQFSLHYDGQAAGPVHPFAFEIGYLVEESGFLSFHDPYLTTARTQILDYFTALGDTIRSDHVLFRFEQTMTFGSPERRLLNQLCVQMGFDRVNGNRGMARYFSGEDPALVDHYPELGLFRDIVFLFKALLAPTSTSLPEVRRWKSTDARLFWSVGKKAVESEDAPDVKQQAQTGEDTTVILNVAAFGKPKLECAGYARSYVAENLQSKSMLASFLDLLGMGGSNQPRAPPSGANPSNLVGKEIRTEDDVLHVRHLPDFGGRLRARDCELLLQYLTAPYLRIPLVLQFFSDQLRIMALAVPELQGVLDACLFEPGTFLRDGPVDEPKTVPALNRKHLCTGLGLLFNELQHSPKVVLDSIENMLFFALELDVGRYNSNTSQVILYITRLVVRVLEYMSFLIERDQVEKNRERDDLTSRSGPHSMVRGLYLDAKCSETNIPYLRRLREKLREKLDTAIYPMLEQWCEVATKKKESQLACIFHSHMAYLYYGIAEKQLNRRVVTTILIAYIFVSVNFRFNVELDIGDSAKKQRSKDIKKSAEEASLLGIPPNEFFTLYQKHRACGSAR